MKLKLKHSLTLFFATVFADFFVFVISDGASAYSVGDGETAALLAAPATVYLLLCYLFAVGFLSWLDKERQPARSTSKRLLPLALATLSVSLVLGVAGDAFFSIDALSRQHVFRDNPWIPRIVLFTLPLAMLAIICARSWQKLFLFFSMVAFYALTGSRIHVMALILAMIVSYSNRRLKTWHFVVGGVLSIFLLDILASQREVASQVVTRGSYFIQLFSSGHYSTFDIQTLLMHPDENFVLEPLYLLVAAMGPIRDVFGYGFVLSSSEYFTATIDPARFYNDRSLATVGLTGELYMLFGWFGAFFAGIFVAVVALLKRFFEWISGYDHQMETLLRALGFLYIFLVFRADMWIFFSYLWIQLPILFTLAVYISRTKSNG